MNTIKIIVLILAMSLTATASAQKLYKSVDEAGNVTYSDKPPADAAQVEKVQVEPGPTAEQVEEAQQRLQQTEQAVGEMERNRQSRQEQSGAQGEGMLPEVPEVETSGTTVDDGRRDLKPLIPVESPRPGEEHPVYQPGKRPPSPPTIQPLPRPRPRPAR